MKWWHYPLALLLVLLIGWAFITFTEPGKGFAQWFSVNWLYVVVAVLFLVILYLASLLFVAKKPKMQPPWKVLEASCNDHENGLAFYGVVFEELVMRKDAILTTDVPAETAIIVRGPIRAEGQYNSFKLYAATGNNDLKMGRIMDSKTTSISDKETAKLCKTEMSYEDQKKNVIRKEEEFRQKKDLAESGVAV